MKKRFLSVVLCLCMVLGMLPTSALAADIGFYANTEGSESNVAFTEPVAVSTSNTWDGSIAGSYASGDGTSKSPYQISTASQLARIANQVNNGAESGKYYKLTNDIYLNEISLAGNWEIAAPTNEWTPIGSSETQFSGNFDGAGHTIFGLYISTEENYQGLFGSVTGGGAINNVSVEKAYIRGGDYVGGICGYTVSALNNCHNAATVIGNNYVGGVVGGTGTPEGLFGGSPLYINTCYNAGKISGGDYIGGIVGHSNAAYFSTCYNVGAISGMNRVGGISGKGIKSDYCWNAGNITGATYVAGILAEATYFGSTSSSINSSFNAGAVSGESFVGGILGYSTVYSGYYPSNISNCYNVGSLTGSGDYVGGIAGQGWLCKYFNCYNAGNCLLGSGENVDAVCNYGQRNESNNLYYLAGCCGEGYWNKWGNVAEVSSDAMRESNFVSTLNNGGTAWVQDTESVNLGYPILNGINYATYKDYIATSDIYHIRISANRQTNCLAVGDMLELDVACYLHDSIDSSIQEFTSVVSDSNIVNIAAGGWDDTHGQRYTVIATNVGYTSITFNSPQTGMAVYLDFFVLEGESGYSFDFVPTMEIEAGKTTNFYNYSGLVVDEFSYRAQYTQDGKEIDNYIVTMNIYNISDLYGAVSSYDGEGNLEEFVIIDKMEPSETDFIGSWKDLYYSFGDLFHLLDNEKYYSGKSISKENNVKIKVPAGGYLCISNNPQYSEVVLFVNAVGLALEFATTLKNFVDKADKLPDQIEDALVDGNFKTAVINECIKEFTGDYVNKKILKACKDEVSDITNCGYNDLKIWYDNILDRFQELGIDVIGTVEKKLFSLTGIASTGTNILKRAIGTGKLIDALYTWVELGNCTIFAMNFSKSFEYPGGIYIYAPTVDSTYLSNGITAETTTSDPEVVVHAYRVVDTSAAGLNNSTFADCEYDVYSITMYRSGVIIQPDSEVTVRIPLSDTFRDVDASNIKVYRHNNDGSLTNMHAVVVGGYAIFTTDHFSYYSIVAENGSKIFCITFDANDGAVSPSIMTTEATGKLSVLPAPTRDGYTFDGWYMALDGGEQITTETVFSENTTVYAHWAQNITPPDPTVYIISFNANGGTVNPATMTTGQDGTLANLPTPIRSNYTFTGWYTASTGGDKITTDTVFVSNATIYAQWAYTGISTPSTPSNSGGWHPTAPLYNISVPSVVGGKVSVSPVSASAGSTVTITVTPNSGYELTSLTVTGSNGKNIELTNVGSGKYAFTMPNSAVTVGVVFSKIWNNPFTDVVEGSWYYDAVKFANENGLMNGIGNGMFAPNADLSRAMLVQIFYNKEGKPEVGSTNAFLDVPSGTWYSDAVAWAVEKGIVNGYGNGLFGPDDSITREQLAVILYRYAETPIPPNLLLNFSDVSKISSWAQDAVCWAVDQGILNGKGNGILDPTGKATRAEAAQMLKNYLLK